jgi:hypothetical protein
MVDKQAAAYLKYMRARLAIEQAKVELENFRRVAQCQAHDNALQLHSRWGRTLEAPDTGTTNGETKENQR